ncbi:MAG: protein kinase [Planctomycetota bacterium]
MTGSDEQPVPADPSDESSDADRRMADLLRESSHGAEMRRKLQDDESKESDDLLSRLNALDFVQQVVGGEIDLPERIGGYAIKGLLGRGGMGTVYLGWQSDLEREVALKVLAPGYTADLTMRKRFRAEARATAALHHRSIVPIYDYGEAQGMLFFAMERVEGMSLDKHILAAKRVERSALDPREAARRFAGVADALGLAHRRRLLHRDVKPGNILVAEDGTLALTDFGLAKALDHASMNLTSKGGGFLGTLHYASPEQALGRELTPASDLYSLGVTMFEAVAGELPLAGKTTEALLQSILHGTPKRLRECMPKPPRDLEAVLDKLLSHEPEDRYQDGEVLARDLQRISDGEPVQIRRQPLHVRLWRRARKNPLLTGALAAIAILVLATAALIGFLSREKTQGRASRHQNRMVQIANDIGREMGPPSGPVPLLEALTGVEAAAVASSPAILNELDAARAEMPDDPQPTRMREAYGSMRVGPENDARQYLRAGRGYEAMRLYDAEIQDAVLQGTGGDLATKIRLYGLYLARGVAKITASVARPNDARTDLALASFLRPGAAFPASLLDVLEVVQSSNVGAAARRLVDRLANSSPERVRTVGLLLWSAARVQPQVRSNMMDFRLDYGSRRQLHLAAASLLSEVPAPCTRSDRPTGMIAEFADAGSRALEQLADPSRRRQLARLIVQAVERSVHPESPLQSWSYLAQLLQEPSRRGPLLDGEERMLAPAIELAAWRELVRLQPKASLARLWLPRFLEFQGDNPGLPGLVEVAAQFRLLANAADAVEWVDRWIAVADGDPLAQLARMRVMLRRDRLQRAQDDAIVAMQNAIEPDAILAEVVQELSSAAQSAEPGSMEALQGMIARFRALAKTGLPNFGAGR